MNRRHWVKWSLLLGLAVAMLAACGDDSKDQEAGSLAQGATTEVRARIDAAGLLDSCDSVAVDKIYRQGGDENDDQSHNLSAFLQAGGVAMADFTDNECFAEVQLFAAPNADLGDYVVEIRFFYRHTGGIPDTGRAKIFIRVVRGAGSSRNEVLNEIEPNDTEASAQDIGSLRPGDRLEINGALSGTDIDRFRTLPGSVVRLRIVIEHETTKDVDLGVLQVDPATGNFTAVDACTSSSNPEQCEVVLAARETQLGLAEFNGESTPYRFTIEVFAP